MDQLVNFIIRPPRADYIPKNDLLDQEFMLKGRWFQRKDLEVINRRGNKLQCSHYMPLTVPEGKRLPCVIYCHGNSGCRVDASEAAIILLPSNITVFTLDFSGSGLSEGEHVTLGWNEKDDLRAVIDHLRTDESVSYIGLWGRSMGAVTSLMYAAEDPSVAGMVLDSPFSVLVDLMMELVDTYKYPLPKFTVKLAIQHMRKVIKKKANFDIMDLDTIQVAKCCFVPVLLGHATDDDFIRPHHSDQIYDSYAGDKNIIKFDGDHNSPRPQFYFDSITIFFHNVLHPPRDVFDEHGPHAMHEFFDKDNWETIHDIDYRNYNIFNESSGSEPVASSTEDAINRLRARRPISRTEVPADISADVRQFETQVSGQLNTATTNDEYVEYAFGLYGDMPCSMEDEERMLMEAILQSLKDTVVTNPQEQDVHSNSSTSQSIQSSNSEASPPDCSSSSCAASSSTAEPGTAMPKSYSPAPVGKSSSSQESSTSNGICSSADGNTSAHDADTSGGTRATLVVEKHGTGDGFAQRWGLNFFKNSSR